MSAGGLAVLVFSRKTITLWYINDSWVSFTVLCSFVTGGKGQIDYGLHCIYTSSLSLVCSIPFFVVYNYAVYPHDAPLPFALETHGGRCVTFSRCGTAPPGSSGLPDTPTESRRGNNFCAGVSQTPSRVSSTSPMDVRGFVSFSFVADQWP